jgi:hypothetical protein
MKKYKIVLGGRGADCYIYRLTDEQHEKLKEGNVDKDEMGMEQILEIINKDFITDSEEIVLGAYFEPDLHHFSVYDENENIIWESNKDWDPEFDDEDEDYKITYDDENILICEDLLKGSFFSYVVETEEDFDSNKLTWDELTDDEYQKIVNVLSNYRFESYINKGYKVVDIETLHEHL